MSVESSIIGVQFGVLNPETIVSSSAVEVVTDRTYQGPTPVPGGIFDPRFGVIEPGKECPHPSCRQGADRCPGHFGHIMLARPVYLIQFLDLKVVPVLKSICISCARLLSKDKKRCAHCNTVQPVKIGKNKDLKVPNIVADFGEKRVERLFPERVQALFRRMDHDEIRQLGMSPEFSHPAWMVTNVIRVPPLSVRPSVVENGRRMEDDLSHMLVDIVRSNQSLRDSIQRGADPSAWEKYYDKLQVHVAQYINNKLPGLPPSSERNGRPRKSMKERLGSKNGRVRSNLMGKRVDFSARSVITPDPNIRLDQVGVPLEFAMTLTKPETVNPANRVRLQAMVDNGPGKYPGAAKVFDNSRMKMRSFLYMTTPYVLSDGDIVHRHLLDGDFVLFNRQPSLHRPSIMGHRVVVLPGQSFRLNPNACKPYNADFDGDEMNMHVPQSVAADAELRELMHLPKHIISPRTSDPIMGPIQDSLTGAYRLTAPGVILPRHQALMLLSRVANPSFSLSLVPNKPFLSGHEVLSLVLPKINFRGSRGLTIENGVLSGGQITGSAISGRGALLHTVYNDMGAEAAVDMLTDLQTVVMKYLQAAGFSMGVKDLLLDEDTKEADRTKLEELMKTVYDLLTSVHTGEFVNRTGRSNAEELEIRIRTLAKQFEDTQDESVAKIPLGSNRMLDMVDSGSKAKQHNLRLVAKGLYQQLTQAKRMPVQLPGRTLPHFTKYDQGLAARGFVFNSYMTGLQGPEFFFHCIGGRDGLIDTAVKSVTPETLVLLQDDDGNCSVVQIGPWIDGLLAAAKPDSIRQYGPEDANMELLQLEQPVWIPTADNKGVTSWGLLSAVTRHDPGDILYDVVTAGGRKVTVTKANSLLVWDADKDQFVVKATADVNVGDFLPTTASLPEPETVADTMPVANHLPKTDYVYGSDFKTAQTLMEKAMEGREHIPEGWWDSNNGTAFTLPYDSKARLQRALVRSGPVEAGKVYPYHATRQHAGLTDYLELNESTGILIGLYLADGHYDSHSGQVTISKNEPSVLEFVAHWFRERGINYTVVPKSDHRSAYVTGYSTLLGRLLCSMCGHDSSSKHIPAEAFSGELDFIVGILNGYFSGDGTVGENCIEAGSVSEELMVGIAGLCNRIGVFAKLSFSAPLHRLSIRAQWAAAFATKVGFIHAEKQSKLVRMTPSAEHRNFAVQEDCVLDPIVSITPRSPEGVPKMYDVTVPSTLNLALFNGLIVHDTSETGYIQRKLVKSMEDITVAYDDTVRNSSGSIIQFRYGEDGFDSTTVIQQKMPLVTMSNEQISRMFALSQGDLDLLLTDAALAETEFPVNDLVRRLIDDRDFLVRKVFRFKFGDKKNTIDVPVDFAKVVAPYTNVAAVKTDLTPAFVTGALAAFEAEVPWHPLLHIAMRFFLAPKRVIGDLRLSKDGFAAVMGEVRHKIAWASVHPCSAVGVLAAQSIGEPTTQMTLNTFHLSGTSKASGTQGVPRIRELIGPSDNPSKPNTYIYLEPEVRHDKETATRLKQDLQLTLLDDVITALRVYASPTEDSVLPEDQEWVKEYLDFMRKLGRKEPNSAPFVVRIEFNDVEVEARGLTMEEVEGRLRLASNVSDVITTDNSAAKLLALVRFDASAVEKHSDIRQLVDELKGTIIHGLPGMQRIFVEEVKSELVFNSREGLWEDKTQYYLVTEQDPDKHYLPAVLGMPGVDSTRTVSNFIMEAYACFGIEAARQLLLQELEAVMASAGLSVNGHHFSLLVDRMCRDGIILPVSYNGIDKDSDMGPLSKASFEQTDKELTKAALAGVLDPIAGISSNIILGQYAPCGTGNVCLLLDEKGMPAARAPAAVKPADAAEVAAEAPADSRPLQAEDIMLDMGLE